MPNVLLVPSSGNSLFSVGRLGEKVIHPLFSDRRCALKRMMGLVSGMTLVINTYGHRNCHTKLTIRTHKPCLLAPKCALFHFWHRQLVHITENDLQNFHAHVEEVPKVEGREEVSRQCRLGKAHSLPFQGKFERPKQSGGVEHNRITGPLVPSCPDQLHNSSRYVGEHFGYAIFCFMVRRSSRFKIFLGFV